MRYLAPTFLAAVLVASAADGQPLYDWTAEAPQSVSSAATTGALTGPDLTASRSVAVDLDLLRSNPGTLAFPIPGTDETLWAVRSRFEERDDGSFVWTGYIPGSVVNSVILVGGEDGLFGTFGPEIGQRYLVSGTRDRAGVRPLHGGGAPDGTHGHHHPPPFVPEDLDEPAIESVALSAVSQQATTATETVDMLVVYTEEAETTLNRDYFYNSWLFGVNWPITYVAEYANETFKNSNTPARFRIVHHQRMPETVDPGPGEYDWGVLEYLQRMQRDEALAKLRAEYDADVVLGLVHSPRMGCGLAYGRTTGWEPRNFAQYAYVHTNVWCGVTSPTKRWFDYHWEIALHELAHLFGAEHAMEQEPASHPLAPYAHGYFNRTEYLRTVMTGCILREFSGPQINSLTVCKYDLLQHFSSATPHPDGHRIGIAGEAENDRLLRTTSAETATFSMYPVAPSELTATSPGTGTVELRWTDNAFNETGFRVYYRRLGRHKWKEYRVGLGYPDLESTWVQGLVSGKQYRFYVRSFNGETKSLMSNKVTVRVE